VRGSEEAVSYTLGHRIRVEILTALHELQSASAIELARIVGQPLSTVTHHISELLKSGSLRIERTEKVRSVEQRFYAVEGWHYTDDEEFQEMTEAERQKNCRVVLESMIAEVLAGFWAGKLTADPRLFLCWNWFDVDAEGRDESPRSRSAPGNDWKRSAPGRPPAAPGPARSRFRSRSPRPDSKGRKLLPAGRLLSETDCQGNPVLQIGMDDSPRLWDRFRHRWSPPPHNSRPPPPSTGNPSFPSSSTPCRWRSSKR
jgi:DNA-binding transcriptional ArsR family regulator